MSIERLMAEDIINPDQELSTQEASEMYVPQNSPEKIVEIVSSDNSYAHDMFHAVADARDKLTEYDHSLGSDLSTGEAQKIMSDTGNLLESIVNLQEKGYSETIQESCTDAFLEISDEYVNALNKQEKFYNKDNRRNHPYSQRAQRVESKVDRLESEYEAAREFRTHGLGLLESDANEIYSKARECARSANTGVTLPAGRRADFRDVALASTTIVMGSEQAATALAADNNPNGFERLSRRIESEISGPEQQVEQQNVVELSHSMPIIVDSELLNGLDNGPISDEEMSVDLAVAISENEAYYTYINSMTISAVNNARYYGLSNPKLTHLVSAVHENGEIYASVITLAEETEGEQRTLVIFNEDDNTAVVIEETNPSKMDPLIAYNSENSTFVIGHEYEGFEGRLYALPSDYEGNPDELGEDYNKANSIFSIPLVLTPREGRTPSITDEPKVIASGGVPFTGREAVLGSINNDLNQSFYLMSTFEGNELQIGFMYAGNVESAAFQTADAGQTPQAQEAPTKVPQPEDVLASNVEPEVIESIYNPNDIYTYDRANSTITITRENGEVETIGVTDAINLPENGTNVRREPGVYEMYDSEGKISGNIVGYFIGSEPYDLTLNINGVDVTRTVQSAILQVPVSGQSGEMKTVRVVIIVSDPSEIPYSVGTGGSGSGKASNERVNSILTTGSLVRVQITDSQISAERQQLIRDNFDPEYAEFKITSYSQTPSIPEIKNMLSNSEVETLITSGQLQGVPNTH